MPEVVMIEKSSSIVAVRQFRWQIRSPDCYSESNPSDQHNTFEYVEESRVVVVGLWSDFTHNVQVWASEPGQLFKKGNHNHMPKQRTLGDTSP